MEKPEYGIGKPRAEIGIFVISPVKILSPGDVFRNIDARVADAQGKPYDPQHHPAPQQQKHPPDGEYAIVFPRFVEPCRFRSNSYFAAYM